jgi:hypothetical protein
MEEKVFTIKLPESSLNYVVNALADKPWKESNDKIQAIISQANAQAQENIGEESPPEE